MGVSPLRDAALPSKPCSVTLATYSVGLAVRSERPLRTAFPPRRDRASAPAAPVQHGQAFFEHGTSRCASLSPPGARDLP